MADVKLVAESFKYLTEKYPNNSLKWRRFCARKRASVIQRIGDKEWRNIQRQIRMYEDSAWMAKEPNP